MTETITEAPEPKPIDAPWGLKPDGTPYKRNPAAYLNRAPRGSKSGGGASAPAKRAGRPTRTALSNGERRTRVADLLTIPASGLAMAGSLLGSRPLIADSIVIESATDPLAKAVADCADTEPAIARIVDTLTATGPYAALLTALFPVALQLAANHMKALPPVLKAMGAMSAEELIMQAVRSSEAKAAA
jgi:hypothetical protein